jgi:hypothetical protein
MASDGQFDQKILFFKFDLENNPCGDGQTISAGKGADFFWELAKQQREEGLFETDKETIVEVVGMGLLGGVDPTTGKRIPIEYIKPIIRKQNVENVYVNETMLPWVNGYSINPGAFNIGVKNCLFTGGMGYGDGILSSGPRTADGIVGQLDVEIKFPLTDDGGVETIDQNIIIPFLVNILRGEDLYKELLAYHGHIATNEQGAQLTDEKTGAPLINQSFMIGDVEDLSNVQEIPKTVPATLVNFEELNGGNRAKAPYMTRDLRYCKNGQATQLNNWFTLEYINQQVLAPEMEMSWNFEENEAINITHLGLHGHERLKWLRLERGGAGNDQMEYDVSTYQNMFQPAMGRAIGEQIFRGPTPLMRSCLIHNRKGAIKIADDGLGVVGKWGAATKGIELQTYGYHYYM